MNTEKKQKNEKENSAAENIFITADIIEKTQFSMGQREQTEQWDIYTTAEAKISIATDRINVHDRIVGCVPYKGAILGEITAFFAELAADICQTDFIATPHPRVILRKKVSVFPVSFRVHGYITSENNRKPNMWDQYKNGVKNYFGNLLPAGLKENQKLQRAALIPIVNKNATTRETIYAEGLVDEALFEEAEEICLKLFSQASNHAQKQGLILASAKYTFGVAENQLLLLAGVHVPESATYWDAKEYEKLFAENLPQKELKETVINDWLANVGFTGNGPAPPIPEEIKTKAAAEYQALTEQLLGKKIVLKKEMNSLEEMEKTVKG